MIRLRNNWTVAAAAVCALGLLAGCGGDQAATGTGTSGGSGTEAGSSAAEPWTKVDASKSKTTASGLTYTIIKEGTGPEIKSGDVAEMHYTGWLKDGGKKFDSSRDHGGPFEFPLGAGQVIPGWDEGVLGMKVGEQRQLIIPAKLGYGDQGAGADIPPGATLVFDVELVGIKGK